MTLELLKYCRSRFLCDIGPKRPRTTLHSAVLGVSPGEDRHFFGALGGTRTPNLLIRSQMLYPLGDQRVPVTILACEAAEQKAD
jgi:hypothetical protein